MDTLLLLESISVIGLVSIVVLIGLSVQELNDWYIIVKAPMNPEITTRIQKNLTNLLVLDMCAKPCIVEDSKYVLIPSMVCNKMFTYLNIMNEEQIHTL